MDKGVLVTLLTQSLDPPSAATAEAELTKVKKIIGFAPSLLEIIMSDSLELPVRQAGVIYFKNMVGASWAERDYDPRDGDGTGPPFIIHEQDKGLIRHQMVDAMVAAPEVIRIQLATAVCIMTKQDFPGRWPEVVDKISLCMQTPEPARWPGALLALYQLVKNYEYKKKEDRAPLYDALNLLLPQLYDVLAQCAGNPTQEAAEIRKQVLKIFFALVQYILPLELLPNPVFTKWMEAFNAIVLSPVPDSVEAVEPEERPSVIWWKEKKWVMHILTRIFERYGSPGNTTSDYKQFAEWYIKTFSTGILASVLKLLDSYRQGIYISPRVMQQAINYVNTGVSHAITWKIIKPNLADVVKSIIFPLMSYTQEDAELWDTDPYEYVRVKFDIFEDFVSPVTAAQTLLHSICKKRKDALAQTMEYLLSVLQNPEANGSQRDGALHMIGTMADILLKKKQYKEKMEEFLVQFTFPAFSSPLGHLRARACWMLHYFADVKYRNENVLGQAFNLTIQMLLNDKEVPVKVEAAIAIQMMLSSQGDAAKKFVEPQIGDITMALLQIIRDTENDDLTSVMQKIVCTYTDQLIPLAEGICNHLVETFAQVLDSSENGDEKAITAMGLLNTMETILSVMESKPGVNAVLEPIVLKAVHHIFTNHIMELYEEALSLCYDLTSVAISQDMWKMLEVIYEVFNHDGIDYFTEMMPLLHNYVTIDNDTFLSNPAFPMAMFNMCKKMLESEPGEDPECHAAKLLEVIILQGRIKKNVDTLVEPFVQTVLIRLGKDIKTSELRTMCLQVAIAAMYYDQSLFFEVLARSQAQNLMPTIAGPLSKHFIDQWLHDTDCFIGLHDRKLSILGLCQLLQLPPGAVPGVAENAARFFPSLLMLFDGLKRAYEQASDSDEDSDDEDEDDDDEGSLDGDVLESDEDEVDESSAMYLESLEAKLKTSSGMRIETSIQDADDYDSDDDSDIYEETSLESYTTTIDEEEYGVDEYVVFKVLLERLQGESPQWYATLVAGMSAEDAKTVQDVLTLCGQRQAAKESKNIEKQGGYNFTQNTSVPGAFNFTSPGGTPQAGPQGGPPGPGGFAFGK